MIIDELVLHNFSVYRGRQVFHLAPPAPDQPIVLIGGENGGGKTTIIDAIQLALYGQLAAVSNRKNLGYDKYLSRCIHQGVDPAEGASVELQLRQFAAGEEQTLRLIRAWAQNGQGIGQEFEVFRNGRPDKLLTDHWAEHVEELIPSGVSSLFFFDGERIEGLADTGSSAKLLASAVHSLLGLDLVDQLARDLSVIVRRKKTGLISKEEQPEIDALEASRKDLKKQKQSLDQKLAFANAELDRMKAKLQNAEKRFKDRGGDLALQREDLEAKHSALRAELAEAREQLGELAAGALPLTLVPKLRQAVGRQAKVEQEVVRAQILDEELGKRDSELRRIAEERGATQEVLSAIASFQNEDRIQREVRLGADCYLRLDEGARRLLERWEGAEQPAQHRLAAELLQSSGDLQEKLAREEAKLAAVPEKEAIENLLVEVAEYRQAVEEKAAAHQRLEFELEALGRMMEQVEGRLAALLEKVVDRGFEDEDAGRTIRSATQAGETLRGFRAAVLDRHIEQISQLVLSSLKKLLHKHSLVHELKIDPVDFSVALYGPNGTVKRPANLSAGERQLLAVSLLWGLAQASGYPLPVIIDTPLGRLDASHRGRLVEKYFPSASHQIVLLSTDEEIDQGHLQTLAPYIGRKYMLDFDNECACTEVREGYFWD